MDVESPRSSRPLSEAWLGGVCAGLADHLGWSVVAIRVLFVLLAATQLIGVGVYLVLWLVMPLTETERRAPGIEAAGRTGMRQLGVAALSPVDLGVAAALGLLGTGVIWLVQSSSWGLPVPVLASGWLAGTGLSLIWWQADRASTREVSSGASWWRHLLRPLLAHWTTITGIALGLVALAAAVAVVVWSLPLGEYVRVTVATVAGVGTLVMATLPWWLRVRRALARAREDRLVADARADMAAHLHDSVLQTLALIQRRAGDQRAVVSLARRQERELRQWLYGQQAPEETLVQALQAIAGDVEADHDIDIDLVSVGDIALDGEVEAVVGAAREAMTNAAKHAGVDRVDVYAEVDEDQIAVYVRDRGTGFDPDEIEPDRLGVRHSIIERLQRAGGRAIIRTGPSTGSEIRLELPR